MLFDFAIFINQFDGAISESEGCEVTGAFTKRHPVMISGIIFELKPFSSLSGVHVPFIDDIVIADANSKNRYLVSSLKEHQETEIHISSCFCWAWRPLILNLINEFKLCLKIMKHLINLHSIKLSMTILTIMNNLVLMNHKDQYLYVDFFVELWSHLLHTPFLITQSYDALWHFRQISSDFLRSLFTPTFIPDF